MSDPVDRKGAAPASLGPWLAFAGAASIWGSTFLAISVGNDALAPVWASAVRLMLAAIALTVWAAVARHPFPHGPALRAALLYGLFAFGFNFPLLYWGEKSVPSGLTAVMYATTPLSSALLARALGMERLTRAKMLGAIVALAGVVVLFSGSLKGAISPAGMVAVFMAACCGATGATLLKRGGRQSTIAANAIASALGAPIAFVASFALRESHALPLTLAALGPLLYLTVAGSMGAFVLFSWLVQRWPVSRSAYVSVVIPMIALSLGSLVRHERLTFTMLGGSALVIVGLVVGMRGSPAPPPEPRPA
jgi:drug/metabolite transporter (DMT)-like permease